MKKRYLALACTAASCLPLSAQLVDLELMLAQDISGSVSVSEFITVMQGYGNAFQSSNITDLFNGTGRSVAVGLSYWASSAGNGTGDFHVGWNLIDSPDSAWNFGQSLLDISAIGYKPTGLGSGTQPYRGINWSVDELLSNSYDAPLKVLDLAADGTSNAAATRTARDYAAANGISINALVFDTGASDSLFNWYTDHAITGENAFVATAETYEAFAAAVALKLESEIIVVPPDDPITPIPEPSALGMLGFAVTFGLVTARRRR